MKFMQNQLAKKAFLKMILVRYNLINMKPSVNKVFYLSIVYL